MAYKNKTDAQVYAHEWYLKSKNITKQCIECQQPFVTRYKKQKYCSLQCAVRNKKHNNICQKCSKIFFAPPSKKRQFCSHKCASNSIELVQQSQKRMLERWKNGEFKNYSWPKQSQEHKTKVITRLKSLIGEKNPMWKGGVTPLYRKVRNMPEYKSWRIQCMIRDDFTCQDCRLKGGYLEVDHIIPFAILLQKEDWQTMWNMSNGKTLCKPCHRKTPTYGKNVSLLTG